jgi:hypothetical protein
MRVKIVYGSPRVNASRVQFWYRAKMQAKCGFLQHECSEARNGDDICADKSSQLIFLRAGNV